MTNIRLLERNIIWGITREPMNTGGSVVYWKDIVHILGAGKRKHHVTREEFTKNHFMEWRIKYLKEVGFMNTWEKRKLQSQSHIFAC